MATDVDICNRALSRIGHTQILQSLADGGPEGEQCDLHFEDCRDEALQFHAWNFATKRVVLAELALVERSDWEHVYTYPTDCLFARFVVPPGIRNPMSIERIEFRIEANDAGTGRVILTDQPDAELVYTMRHTATQVWPATFSSALGWRLAVELALGVKKDPAMAERILKGYEQTIMRAAGTDANEGQGPLPATTPSIAARRR